MLLCFVPPTDRVQIGLYFSKLHRATCRHDSHQLHKQQSAGCVCVADGKRDAEERDLPEHGARRRPELGDSGPGYQRRRVPWRRRSTGGGAAYTTPA